MWNIVWHIRKTKLLCILVHGKIDTWRLKNIFSIFINILIILLWRIVYSVRLVFIKHLAPIFWLRREDLCFMYAIYLCIYMYTLIYRYIYMTYTVRKWSTQTLCLNESLPTCEGNTDNMIKVAQVKSFSLIYSILYIHYSWHINNIFHFIITFFSCFCEKFIIWKENMF